MEMLKGQYMSVAASRDKLQEQINKVTLNQTGKRVTAAVVLLLHMLIAPW